MPAAEVQLNNGPDFLDRNDELRGLSEPVPHVPEIYTGSWSLNTRLYPDTLGMSLACAFGISATGDTGATHYAVTTGNGVITDPDGSTIPTGAYRHVWTAPHGPSGASPKTHNMFASYKDQSVFLQGKGCATENWAIETPERGGTMLTASGPAAYVNQISDPSLTPATETLATRPFMRGGQLVATWLSGTATADSFSIGLQNPVDLVRSLGTESKYPDIVEKAEGLVVATGTVSKRQLDVDDFNALRDATEFAAKCRWRSDTVIASSYRYSFFVEMPSVQYTDGNLGALANLRRIGGSFGFRATRNASASTILTIVNNVASYA